LLNSWSTVLWIVLVAAVVYPLIAVVLRSDSWWAKIAMFVVVVVWSFALFFFGVVHGSIQIGAGRGSNNQWILQSYDQNKGYTFVQNGVSYQTDCAATGKPVLQSGAPNTDPDALPPNLALDGESDCADILPYLHKSVPLRQVDGTLLVFTEEQNYKLEFKIREAK
jgi:hypothetical protein